MLSPTVMRFKRSVLYFCPHPKLIKIVFSGSLIWGSLKWSYWLGRCWSSWQLSSASAATAYILRVLKFVLRNTHLMSQMRQSFIPTLRLAGLTPQLTEHIYLGEPSSTRQQGSSTSAQCAEPKKMLSKSQWKEIPSIPRKLARSTLCFR